MRLTDEVIALEDVRFGYGAAPVLRDVTLRVQAGELCVLLGPNGGGKSTLAKLALGLLRPQEGTARLFGQPAHRFREWHRVAYVPQRAAGFEAGFPATVAEVVDMGRYSRPDPLRIFRRGMAAPVAEALEFAGVWEHRHARITELSRGQQQRVLIARAIVRPRDLLVLDEPLAGVDSGGQQSFYSLIERLHSERKLTTVLISHDIGMALRIATKVVCIDGGLVFHGAPDELHEGVLAQLYGPPMGLMIHHHGRV